MAKAKTELDIVKSKISGMNEMIAATQVTNNKELELVSDKIKQVKMLEKFVTQEKEKYVAPAKKIIEEARDQYDPYIKECKNAEIILKDKAKKYMVAQDEERIKQTDKIAAKVESGKMKPETAIEKMESLPEEQRTVRSDNNSALTLSKRKVAIIQDPDLIPDEYWIIDEVRVRREALELNKKGLPQIPGVEIREEADLSSR